MENIKNMEIINISTIDGKLFALLSYQDLNKSELELNGGYNTKLVPLNIRELQYSSRGNQLCNQSIGKEESKCVLNNN